MKMPFEVLMQQVAALSPEEEHLPMGVLAGRWGEPASRIGDAVDALKVLAGEPAYISVRPPDGEPPAPCSGMTFEHHDRLESTEDRPGTWRCPACGGEGDRGDVAARLSGLAYMAQQLHNSTGYSAVILLPSARPPMFVGHVFGLEIYRVQGIDGPVAAVRQPVAATDGDSQ